VIKSRRRKRGPLERRSISITGRSYERLRSYTRNISAFVDRDINAALDHPDIASDIAARCDYGN
jgi:hypothetical protein